MSQFRQVLAGLDVAPLLGQIAAHPELWGSDTSWTGGKPQTVLSRMGMAADNICLRYNKTLPPHRPDGDKHWNRPARAILTEADPLLAALMAAVQGVTLGRVLISRMAPGAVIEPHLHFVQFGAPKIFDTFQMPLDVAPGVDFWVEGESLYMPPGTAWGFDNQRLHAVYNRSNRPRISLMADIQLPPPDRTCHARA